MNIFKNTLAFIIILFATTAMNAQVGTEKESEKNKKESSWGKKVGDTDHEYKKVVFGECISGDCENGYGILEKFGGREYNETYEGNFINGLLTGQGTHIKNNDDLTVLLDGHKKMKYVGNWEKSIKAGQGVETRYDENGKVVYKYVGAWENDTKNGAGEEFVNGDLVYSGNFKNGYQIKESGCITGDCENGYGVFIDPNKEKYIGEFINGLKNGFGIVIDSEGNYNYGDWKNNKEDGYFKIFNKNNELIFSVEMKDGEPLQKLSSNGVDVGCITGDCMDGYGHYLAENGDEIRGEWVNGVLNGYVTYTWSDKSKYVGEFYEGTISGYGKQYDAEGQLIREGKYIEGEYIDGSDKTKDQGKCIFGNCGHGYGVFIVELASEWERGYTEHKNDFDSKYEGLWISEFKNLVGFSEDKDGNTYVGQFKKGEFEGKGVASFVNGDMYDGSFEDGAMSGQGTMTYADGSKYVGEWSYNDKEGQGKEYDKNGKLLYSGEFNNNERDD